MRIVVLGGAGLMGQVTVRDLLSSPQVDSVVVGDYAQKRVEKFVRSLAGKKAEARFIDVTNHDSLARLLSGADAVINSVQYYYNIDVMKAALASHVPYCDLGGLYHMTKKQLALDRDFKKAGLPAVLGVGSTPGITNVLARIIADQFDAVDYIHIYNGNREFSTQEKKGPFVWGYSLNTIVDEVTSEPACFEKGKMKFVPPLSGSELYEFPEPIGILSVHHSLHSELATIPDSFRDKGIKECFFKLNSFGLPPDVVEKLKFVGDIGLLSREFVKVRGQNIAPRDVFISATSAFPQPSGVPDDCEAVIVDIRGKKDGKVFHHRMSAMSYPKKELHTSGGTLLTAVPPSIVAQMLVKGEIEKKGVLAPENCINPDIFMKELRKRDVRIISCREEIMD